MTIQPAGRGLQLIGVYSFFLALTTLTIILRTYCRVFLVKKFALDDWLAAVAWLFFVFFAAFAITGAYHGSGQHAADIKPPTEIPVGLKWWWACEPVYVLSSMAIKASIAVMLLRLTIVTSHRIVIYVTLAIAELYGAFYFFLFVLQCRPSSYFWTQYTGGKGTCVDAAVVVNATYAYSAITCAGDWTLAILPFFMVWKLQMNSRTKLVVALILAMGAIASTATIIRIPYVSSLANAADFLYATTDVAIWSCCETGLGIAAANIATLRPVFRSFLSHSKILGYSKAPDRQASPWPLSGGHQAKGYIRSQDEGGIEELGFRDDTRKTVDMTVVQEDCNDTIDSSNKSSETRITERKSREDPFNGRSEWNSPSEWNTRGTL